VEEPLTSFSDPMAAQRLLAAATLARDSTHYLHGHLLTILGFAELLQEEEAESGRKDGYGASLVHAGQRLRARLDALLYLLSTVSEPPHPTRRESLGGVMREVALGQEVTIDCHVPEGRVVALDPQGLRCLLRELLVLADPSSTITLALRPGPQGAGERLEVACGEAPQDPAAAASPTSVSAERVTELAVIEALAAALGGTCIAPRAPAGAGDLRVSIPLPEPTQPISPEGVG
jgi:hypothetical protein